MNGERKREAKMENRKESERKIREKEQGEAPAEKRRGVTYLRLVAVLAGLTVLMNLLACIPQFCDAYKRTVYGIISDVLGMATAWLPVALGEILGYLGALALLFGVVILLLFVFMRRRAGFRRFAVGYGKGLLLTLVILLFVYTMHWVIPFRGSILKVKGAAERQYSLLEVQNVRNDIVRKLNACANEVARDENGSVIYDHKAIAQAVSLAMKAQAKDYPLLSGYYPPMKDALCSDFLEWMDIGGYTYPYTMEVTWNVYCNDLFYPFLFAHESSHHQGYYQENEANFIAFLACTQSDDPLLRYAGYNEICYYVNKAYVETLIRSMEAEAAMDVLGQQPKVGKQVLMDRSEAWGKSQEKYEAVSHPAQQLQETSAKVADVGWSVQGDLLQENSYDGVVLMVLQYYDAMGAITE